MLFIIGYFASKKIKNIKDYYVGGKKLGYWIVAFLTKATGESAWLLLGLTGLGAIVSISALWVVVGEVIGVSNISRIGIYFDKLDVILPSFLLAIITGVIVSKLTAKNSLSS